MPIISCEQCSKSFYVKPNRLERGRGKFCSNACKHLGQKTGILTACTWCGNEVYKSAKGQLRSKSGAFFCNKSCQTKWRNSTQFAGAKHANWKDGNSSYRAILKRATPNQVCAKCHTDDARILAVHHKDKSHKNNDPSNLLWLCHNCHYLVHHYPEEAAGFLVPPLAAAANSLKMLRN